MSIKNTIYQKRNSPNEKRIRINTTVDSETEDKLKKLAVSCELPKSTMLYEIARTALNHPDFVNFFQDVYNKNPQYRVTPIKQGNKVYY